MSSSPNSKPYLKPSEEINWNDIIAADKIKGYPMSTSMNSRNEIPAPMNSSYPDETQVIVVKSDGYGAGFVLPYSEANLKVIEQMFTVKPTYSNEKVTEFVGKRPFIQIIRRSDIDYEPYFQELRQKEITERIMRAEKELEELRGKQTTV